MYKKCQSEHSTIRQRQLEQGLLEAMKTKHYEQISVSDLCQQMGVPRKTFYRYFSGKEGALHSLIDHVLQDYDLYVSPNLREDSSALEYMELIFSYWLQRKDVLDVLQRSDLTGMLIIRAILLAQEETAKPIRFLPAEVRAEQKHITIFMVCGLMSMVAQWHHEGYQEPVRQMAQIALRLLTEPLVATEGK